MALINKILVPVDFSQHSRHAIEYAAEMASKFGASMTILHAYTVPVYPLGEGYVFATPEQMSEILKKTEDAVREARALAEKHGVTNVDTRVVEAYAFVAIVKIARDDNYDLIVMGTHGRTGLKHALIGSVAEKVVRKATCPVLTVRAPEHEFEKP